LTEFQSPAILVIGGTPSLVLARIFHLVWPELTHQVTVSQRGESLRSSVRSAAVRRLADGHIGNRDAAVAGFSDQAERRSMRWQRTSF